jgi:hypothetical protein
VKKPYYIVFMKWVLLLIPVVLFVQQAGSITKIAKLNGAYEKAVRPYFSWNTWFSAEFQAEFEQYNNQNFGFRPSVVRLANQLKYSVFQELANPDLIEFENQNLISKEYIEAYLGVNRTKTQEVKQRCRKLKRMATFMEERGKVSLVIIAPDKTSFYSKVYKLPPSQEVDSTNYKTWVYYLDQFEIPYIDFRKVFLEAKDTSKYPLFTNQGIHWNTYGSQFALDSVAGYLNSQYKFNAPRMKVDSIFVSDKYRKSEYDIERSLNLIYPLPKRKIGYQSKRFTKGKKPSLLMVSDSFFFELYSSGFANRLFDDPLFYYYHKRALKFSDFEYNQDPRANSLKGILAQIDVLCLMAVDMNLKDFPWAFSARFKNHVLNDTSKSN